MSSTEHRMLIDGRLVAAEDGRAFANEDPATEERIGAAPDASAADVDRAIQAARRAFDVGAWAHDAALRREALLRFHRVLRARVDEFRPLLVAESGMPVGFARALGVDPAIEYLPRFLEMFEALDHERRIEPKPIFGRSVLRRIRREPVGVVAAITPWNVPFELGLRKIGLALVTGNTVVLKPAPQTPWSGTLLAAAAAEAGLPRGVLNIVTTSDNGLAGALTADARVDQITFTGSTATGRKVMASAAATIKRVGLELGGKSAAILLDDLDAVESIVQGVARGVCQLAGQGCTLLTRLLAPRRRLGEVAEIAQAALDAVPYGDPSDPANLMGPLISAAQMQRVLGYMELGRREARLVTGGGRAGRFARGYFVQPTLFTAVPPDARIAQEEIFGPVLSLFGYDDEDEAVRIADGTVYGLSAAVFGADPARAEAIARRLRTGVVSVNGAPWFDAESPFGGYKQSGIGREFGREGLEEFMETKTIALPA